MYKVCLSGSSSLPGLSAPSRLPSLQYRSFGIAPLCHAAGLGLPQLLAGMATLELGPASWQHARTEELQKGTSLVAPCFWSSHVNPSLLSSRPGWEAPCSCWRDLPCVYPGSSSSLYVPSCSSSFISASFPFSGAPIMLLALKTFGTWWGCSQPLLFILHFPLLSPLFPSFLPQSLLTSSPSRLSTSEPFFSSLHIPMLNSSCAQAATGLITEGESFFLTAWRALLQCYRFRSRGQHRISDVCQKIHRKS